MKKILIALSTLLLTSCALLDAYLMAPYDATEYLQITEIRVMAGQYRQQCRQRVVLGVLQRRRGGNEMDKTGGNALDLGRVFSQTWQKLGHAKVAEGAGAFKSRDVQGHGVTL